MLKSYRTMVFTFFGFSLFSFHRLIRFHSPLLSESRLISFPFLTKMIYFRKFFFKRFSLGTPLMFLALGIIPPFYKFASVFLNNPFKLLFIMMLVTILHIDTFILNNLSAIKTAEKRDWTFVIPSWMVCFNQLNYFSPIQFMLLWFFGQKWPNCMQSVCK